MYVATLEGEQQYALAVHLPSLQRRKTILILYLQSLVDNVQPNASLLDQQQTDDYIQSHILVHREGAG